jgi:hypothetical protein
MTQKLKEQPLLQYMSVFKSGTTTFLLYIKDVPVHTMKVHEKMEVLLHSFLTSALDGDEQLAS